MLRRLDTGKARRFAAHTVAVDPVESVRGHCPVSTTRGSLIHDPLLRITVRTGALYSGIWRNCELGYTLRHIWACNTKRLHISAVQKVAPIRRRAPLTVTLRKMGALLIRDGKRTIYRQTGLSANELKDNL
jgi:hypothetical protein